MEKRTRTFQVRISETEYFILNQLREMGVDIPSIFRDEISRIAESHGLKETEIGIGKFKIGK